MSRALQYLLSAYILGYQDDPPIRTNAVAETLERSPATVTETFQRLDEDELVEYEAYKEVTLTDAGRERAGELHETYVTISWFFRSLVEACVDTTGPSRPIVGVRSSRPALE
jgi:DtxR family Mn-dependent transcriptional regulator